MTGERDRLTYADALQRILAASSPLSAETLPFAEALGRHLAQPLIASQDSPAFDNSAVDGYCVHAADLSEANEAWPVALLLAGVIRAGDDPSLLVLEPGTTLQILTGAPLPAGAEAVVMQEDVVVADDLVHFSSPISAGSHIRRRGEEYRKGDELLPAGAACNPAVIALSVSNGCTHLPVHGVPTVAIVSTGSELVEPGQSLSNGRIWESNSFGLMAALECLGIQSRRILAADTLAETTAALEIAFAEADVVLTSGGVSVGDHDFVKRAFDDLGVQREFWGVRIKPGGPFYFGTLGQKLLFGLPGNPVSALVTFFVFVRPALLKMMGGGAVPAQTRAKLASTIEVKGDRMEFVRGRMTWRDAETWVEPLDARGSHMMGGLAAADCLIHAASGAVLAAGDTVEITPLRWSEL